MIAKIPKAFDSLVLNRPNLLQMEQPLKAKKIGGNIRTIREILGYTQEYVALELGITQGSYGKIEKGITKLTVERLNQIAKILKVQPSDLLNENGANQIKEPQSIYGKELNNPDTLYLKTLENLVKHLEGQLQDKDEIIKMLKNKDK